ncbi:MAG: hypothetical protein NTZ39_11740 [Methanoregula sp.]|nr:hypothetical protein [Methanoregula sp.]
MTEIRIKTKPTMADLEKRIAELEDNQRQILLLMDAMDEKIVAMKARKGEP